MKKIALLFSLLLMLCALAAAMWVWRSGAKQYDTAVENWHRHLSTIAETRKNTINEVLGSKKEAVEAAANNINIRSLLTEHYTQSADITNQEANIAIADKMRLQDYLHDTAKQHAFDSENSGLAIISGTLDPIHTQDFAKYESNNVVIEDNQAFLYHVAPIKALHTNTILGHVHGKYPLTGTFYQLLHKPDTLAKSDETSLIIDNKSALYQLHGNGVLELKKDNTSFAEALYHPDYMVSEKGFTQIAQPIADNVSLLHRVETSEITAPIMQNRKQFRMIGLLLAGISLLTSLVGWLFATRKQAKTKANYQRQLVDKMVELVDSRDSHTIKHSEKVSELSRQIATAMDAPHHITRAAAIAGRLMNIGKVSLDKTLLTKTDTLNADEKRKIQESAELSNALVKDVDFDAPVYETLTHFPKPYHEAKEAPLSTHIIKVANAYTAMSSPRAYRDSLMKADIIEYLRKEAGTKYSPDVVQTLEAIS